jgi:membrane protein
MSARVLTPMEAWRLAKRSVQGWMDDGAPSMGAALAFYTLFSLAPVLLVTITVAGYFIGRNEAQDILMGHLTQVMGEKAASGVASVLEAAGSREPGRFAFMGFFTLLLGATTVFAQLRADLDRIWHYSGKKPKGVLNFLMSRLLAFGVVMSVGFLLLVSMVLSAVLSALGDYWFASSELMVRMGELGVSFVLFTGLFAAIYKLLPSTRLAWGDVWVGAAVTSILFAVGKVVIGLYIGKAAVLDSFGAAATLIVVIMWVYYSAQVFFLGAEFTREYALLHGSKRGEKHVHERRRYPPATHPDAANDQDMVERAQQIVKGKDPVLLRK